MVPLLRRERKPCYRLRESKRDSRNLGHAITLKPWRVSHSSAYEWADFCLDWKRVDAAKRIECAGLQSGRTCFVGTAVLKLKHVHQISKRPFPGCVKSGQKVAFCLPSAGRKTQLFHHIFFQPGKSLLEIPCTNIWRYWTTLRQLRFILWTSSNHLFHHWIFRPDFHSVLILLNLSINGKSIVKQSSCEKTSAHF